LGDGSLERVPPHLTLVSPVNVRAEALDDAIGVLRAAAAALGGPLDLDLGPARTFLPASPVLYLDVTGPDLAALVRLHGAVSRAPLLRPSGWPWAPHVTVCDEVPLDRADAALSALSRYRAPAHFDRVVMMQETERRWVPLVDAALGPPPVLGRGGLDLEVTRGWILGPDARARMEGDVEGAQALAEWETRGAGPSIVLTGRRRGAVVGAALAWTEAGAGGRIHVLVSVAGPERGQGAGRALFRQLEVALAQAGWVVAGARGHGPAAFFAACSAWGGELGGSV
jgi:2'-5' RNA ligase